jgi:UDP-N-acetylglucosamine 2-epimerase
MDHGTMILGGVEKENLINAIYVITKYRKTSDEIPEHYKNTDCSDRVLKLILGLSRLVDRRRKSIEY